MKSPMCFVQTGQLPIGLVAKQVEFFTQDCRDGLGDGGQILYLAGEPAIETVLQDDLPVLEGIQFQAHLQTSVGL